MLATVLFGITSVLWGVMGVAMTVVPQVWTTFLGQVLGNDWKRFWLTQSMIFVGLILVIGTFPYQGFWLWVTCGVIMIGKACVLLGAGKDSRMRLLALIEQWPLWAYRCGGLVMVILAVFLATDVILNG